LITRGGGGPKWPKNWSRDFRTAPNDEWLVTDEYDFRIFYISADGHLLQTDKYNPAPYNALLFGQDILAIRTVEGINLHKLSWKYKILFL